jgi:acetyl-CoA C-acetyltransferase
MAQFSAADPIVILSYARTPMGSMQGALADVAATDLGATAVKAAVERAGVDGADVERVYMGCVLPAGLGQAPARQAAIKAGLPKSAQATTVNKVCGSGMQTVIMASEALAAGSIDLAVAGGMESMTNAPTCSRSTARARASATTWPMTTCSSMAWKTPMTRAARWALSRRIPPMIMA